ncbi:LysR family transcriptional regulator [Pantoea sp. B65]|uniref:LysR family transcriptional regulator n=1 Tax=Pantoea sp. B65 TaxID=2813359 RepID=UPI0039B38FD5
MKNRATLQELEIFAAIARHLSFRKAAEERNVTPSTLSHAMTQLEQRIGLRLLQRTTRSVALTEAGQAFLLRIQPAINDLTDAVDDLNSWRAEPRGTLKLNMPRAAEALYFSDLLLPFKQAYPDITLEIASNDGFVNIVEQGFDAGVRYGNEIAQDMIAIPFGPALHLIAVASPDFIAAYGRPAQPEDLLHFPCIQRRFASGKLYKWEFVRQQQQLEIAVRGDLILDNDHTMIAAACAAAGIAFLHRESVRQALATGQLVALLEEFSIEMGGLSLYYPGRKYLATPLRHFISWLQQYNQQRLKN